MEATLATWVTSPYAAVAAPVALRVCGAGLVRGRPHLTQNRLSAASGAPHPVQNPAEPSATASPLFDVPVATIS